MVEDGRFTSTREAYRELADHGGDSFDWAKLNQGLFVTPNAKEGAFVVQIYGVKHFQANIEQQKILRGGKNADPFLIARAATTDSTVLTMEQPKSNAAKIPNICKHFSIQCVDLRQFMEREGWVF